jgi:osmotically-inducible protein OsmY
MKLQSVTTPNALRRVDTHVFVEEKSNSVTLLGTVASVDERERAELVARALTPGKRLENRLEVDPALQAGDLERSEQFPQSRSSVSGTISLEGDGLSSEGGLYFGAEPVRVDLWDMTEEDLYADETDDNVPYFPATDPVITTTSDGEITILGGFSSTAMDDMQVAVSADGQVGDEALAEAVQLELREDASTTDLPIVVHVRDGIVYLHGQVPDLVDTDNAIDVASHVPGVDEIVDRLEVAALGR